jgi:hypothetical protein
MSERPRLCSGASRDGAWAGQHLTTSDPGGFSNSTPRNGHSESDCPRHAGGLTSSTVSRRPLGGSPQLSLSPQCKQASDVRCAVLTRHLLVEETARKDIILQKTKIPVWSQILNGPMTWNLQARTGHLPGYLFEYAYAMFWVDMKRH